MKQYVATNTTPPFGKRGTRSRFETPTQKMLVYDALEATGDKGLTAIEIATATKLAIDRVRFHLSDLRRSGYIFVKGDPTTVSPTMSAQEAAFAAMLGLENALVARAREGKITSEMEIGFAKYNKIKELALRPGTGPEGKVALRMALIELVKLVF